MTLTDRINGAARRLPAWPIYIVGLIPAVWLFYLGATNQLGPEPVKVLEHEYGLIALQLLVGGLAITPLRKYAGVNLLKFRRAIGVLSFLYVTFHLLVWLVLDVQIVSEILKDIYKRPYITIGMVGFLVMLPLALTSNNWSVRKLGAAAWRRLHQLTYAAVILGAVHFVMLSKGFQLEPLLYLAAALGLVALRVKWTRRPVPQNG
ncbi:MAG: protein-methionine-sulfoxide reductase heme-binding subunit MsrQ [Pseudomonadota bacterium]